MEPSLLWSAALLSCLCGTLADPVRFRDCGSGNIRSVNIVSCKKQPCRLKVRSRVTFEASFVAPFSSSTAYNDISAYIERSKFVLPEPSVNACINHIQPRCPLRRGELYTYRYTLPVREIYPATRATIEYRLTSREGRLVGCAHIPVIIVR